MNGSETDKEDDYNATWEAYKNEVSEHKRLVAARLIADDLGVVLCTILRCKDSCLEAIKRMRSIPP